jgi:hypothetical protein
VTLIDHAPAAAKTATTAKREAASNSSANARALAETQPQLLIAPVAAGLTWIYARDGALTAQDEHGGWWSGCSVPAAAARAMLKAMDVRGSTGCFLNPPHAAALRVAMDALRPEQALIAIIPDDAALAVLLSCESFADDVTAGRIWFAAGPQWASQLDEILTIHPGLPTPAQFVRLLDGIEEPIADALVSPAQRVFSDHASRRLSRIAHLRDAPRAKQRGGGCVIAPSVFRLWDDAGHVLGRLAGEMGWQRFDPDVPTTASPLALAECIASADVVLAANTGRADVQNVAPSDVAWVTWLTGARIPAFDAAAGPRDLLLLADPRSRDAAAAAGWPADRVHAAAWPPATCCEPAAPAGALTLIADVRRLDPPRRVIDLSSHRLLWEHMREELAADPFLAAPCVNAYLDARLSRFAIAELDRRLFIEELIMPACVRGVARMLADERVGLRVFGAGWDLEEKLTSCWRGPIRSRQAFDDAVSRARALVHPWPRAGAHPIDAVGRPVIRALAGRAHMLRSAAAVGSGSNLPQPLRTGPPLSAALLRTLVDHTS